jgi:uncharacterized membrane protein
MLRSVKARFAAASVILVAALGTVVAVSAGAAAPSSHPAAAKPPKPAVGTWQIVATAGEADYINGTFTITSNYYVTAFQGTLTTEAPSACGTGTVAVSGKQKITYQGDEYNVAKGGQLVKVKVTHNGKKVRGKFELEFNPDMSEGGTSAGGLDYGSGCRLSFGIAPS